MNFVSFDVCVLLLLLLLLAYSLTDPTHCLRAPLPGGIQQGVRPGYVQACKLLL